MADNKASFPLDIAFPDASAIFKARYEKLDTVKEECLVGLDTNILLAPYSLGSRELAEIKKAYLNLLKAKRLFIPGQVAREFAKHRSSKLADISKALQDMSSRAQAPMREYADLLSTADGYADAVDASQKIDGLCRSFRAAVSRVTEDLKSWEFSDPVLNIYREGFAEAVFDLQLDEASQTAFEKDLTFRYEHSIPPGYADKSKSDGGAGDLLIWKTILKIGAERKKPFVFVTADQKRDWWTQSNNGPFHPRYELIDEYRRASAGCTLHVVQFSTFLATFGVGEEIVNEVRKVEDANTAIQGTQTKSSAESITELQKLMLEREAVLAEINLLRRQVSIVLTEKSHSDVDTPRERHWDQEGMFQLLGQMEERLSILNSKIRFLLSRTSN